MSISQKIKDSVNTFRGSGRKDYSEFIAGLMHLNESFALYIGRPLDAHILETFEDVSASEFVEVLKAVGWEPKRGETDIEFDARLRKLPIFALLGLVDDDEAVFIEDGEAATDDVAFVTEDELEERDAGVTKHHATEEERASKLH